MIPIMIVLLIGFIILGLIYAPMIVETYQDRDWRDFEGLCLTILITFVGLIIVGIIFILSIGIIAEIIL